jgi:spoIIIJ-associated protein
MTEPHDSRLEFAGKTMEEALAQAAQNFGVAADQLDVEILAQPGSLSSLFGRKVRIAARLKTDTVIDSLRFELGAPVRPRVATGNGFDPAEALLRIAGAIADGATVETRETDDALVLDIKAEGSGIFIGRKGATLEALQFLVTLMAQKQGWQGKRLVIDSERYRERRVATLRDKTKALAERALATGQSQRTELLDAAMRKVVHNEIKNYPGLRTKSLGDGDFKRVQIGPANGDSPAPRQRPRRHSSDRRPRMRNGEFGMRNDE